MDKDKGKDVRAVQQATCTARAKFVVFVFSPLTSANPPRVSFLAFLFSLPLPVCFFLNFPGPTPGLLWLPVPIPWYTADQRTPCQLGIPTCSGPCLLQLSA